MNQVFLLGAGFSRWQNPEMPLLRGLASLLSNELSRELGRDDALNTILNKERNVEKLLSYLAVDYPWMKQDEVFLHKSLYIRIVKEIGEELGNIQKNLSYPLNFGSHEYRLFNYWYEEKSDIVTFNYDNTLEKGLSRFSNNSDWYYFYNLPIRSLSSRSKPDEPEGFLLDGDGRRPSVPNILKLHGSLNWLFNGDFSNPSNENVYYFDPFEPESRTWINRQGLSELIIPPTLDKSSYIINSFIKCIWQNAKELLLRADEVVIIGYSFPLSDLYMDLFLKSCITERHSIVVVDANATRAFQNRVKEIFAPMNKRGRTHIRFIVGERAVERFIESSIPRGV